MADGRQQICTQVLLNPKLKMGAYSNKIRLHTVDLATYDVILGMPWLTSSNPTTDWQLGLMRFEHEGTWHVGNSGVCL